MQVRACLAAIAGLLLLACGCGLTFRHAQGPTPTTPIPLETHTRQLKVGDKWTYTQLVEMSSSMGDPIRGQSVTSRHVITLPLQGVPTLTIAEGRSYGLAHNRGLNQLAYGLLYLRQEPTTGALYEIADTGYVSPDKRGQLQSDDPQWKADLPEQQAPPRLVSNPEMIVPAYWSNNMTNNYHLDFNTGETEDVTQQVVGTEQISTMAGVFNTWKVESTHQFGQAWQPQSQPATPVIPSPETAMQISVTSTEWWAPQLGSPVKEVIAVRMGTPGSAITMTYTDLLLETNVPVR